MKDLIEELKNYADIEEDENLKKHTTFRIGGNAKYFIYPKSEIVLKEIFNILEKHNIPHKIFGKGSNILCSDNDYEGAIICLDRYFQDYYFEENNSCIVQAGASIILLAHEAMKNSLSGLEFASGIPGTLGGAIYMNAGAYKSDIAELVESVYVHINGENKWLNKEELEFSYRTSIFQKQQEWIILGAKLILKPAQQTDILNLMDKRRKRRLESQPLTLPSAGSIFRNPNEISAWEMIDKLGLRGYQIGGAQLSSKHPNFIVNINEAKASDVIELINKVQEEVKKQYNIELKTEVEKFNWK
ncbi:MAG: UDP-N-acetylmuramate dehydrogenase [Erysipelotrichaceae bacterium]